MKKTILSTISLIFILSIEAKDFVHSTDVVKKVKETFSTMETMSADFTIKSKEKNNTRITKGKVYYKKNGLVNFTFTQPTGDKIISNGKKLWIFMASLNAVAVQDLDPQKASLYETAGYNGLVNLFNRYHYSFDDTTQPKTRGKSNYYVFKLREKVSTGGFSEMLLYVDAETFLISGLETIGDNKKIEIAFENVILDQNLPGSLFQYTVEGNTRVVENPLTSEN